MLSKLILFPGFKRTCFFVGSLNMLLASSMFIAGIKERMSEFNVPEIQLNSPHYIDAMFWVFLHMFMIGILVILIGNLSDNSSKVVWTSRVLVVIHCVYAFLDIKTSDNPFGNALYQGPGSVIPVFIDIFYILLFLRFAIRQQSQQTT